MNKIASIVLLWNMERFIVPHLNMLQSGVDKILIINPDRPFRHYQEEHHYSSQRDKSLELVAKYHPNIEIVDYKVDDTNLTDCFPKAYNFGHKLLQDYDLVTRLDVDMFFTESDWFEFIEFLRQTDAKNIVLDWSTNSINYHFTDQYEWGLMNQREQDPLAVSPLHMYGPLYEYPKPIHYWETDAILHHFRSWKTHKRSEIIAFENGVHWMIENHRDWVEAPQELQDKLNTKYEN